MTTLFSEQSMTAKRLLYFLFLLPLICLSQETAAFSYCDASTTWNGTAWSNGEPDQTKDAVFTADYIVSGALFYACSVVIQGNAHVTFTQNSNAVITHNVHVQANGTLTFESGSNLVQTLATQNTGTVTIKRNSSLIKKDAMTLWSSPVSGQNLLDFSPETSTNRFYTFNTPNNIYTMVAPAATNFETAKSYLIRTEEDHPLTPSIWEGSFEGIPNTGNIVKPLVYGSPNFAYNAVGNPYPSPINIYKFLEANEDAIDGTIWLWRKTDDPSKSSYAVVTKLGYQSNTIPDTANYTLQDPFELHEDGILNTGQGFIVKANTNTNLVFNNDMREAVSTANFFKPGQSKDNAGADGIAASRFWINVTAQNVFSQVLIGYTAEATTGYDNGLDGESIMDGTVTLYAKIEGRKLAIEARPEFEVSDVIVLGFKAGAAGTYQFNLDHMDGLFSEGQNIFLRDKLNGTITNLKEGSYIFTTDAGTFDSRFEILYSETLGLPSVQKEQVIIYSNAKQLTIEAPEEIYSIQIYDVTGRLIYSQANIAAQQFTSALINTTEPVIVKIAFTNGAMVTKKTIIQ